MKIYDTINPTNSLTPGIEVEECEKLGRVIRAGRARIKFDRFDAPPTKVGDSVRVADLNSYKVKGKTLYSLKKRCLPYDEGALVRVRLYSHPGHKAEIVGGMVVAISDGEALVYLGEGESCVIKRAMNPHRNGAVSRYRCEGNGLLTEVE
jgi:hypothetical protein